MKNIRFKKVLVMMGILTLAMNGVIGCSSKELTNTATSDAEVKTEVASQQDSSEKEGEKATVQQSGLPTITWYQANNSVGQLTNMGEAECYKELEKRVGVDIVWKHPADGGSMNEQLNLMIAANELPDVVFWNWDALPGGTAKYIKEKVIMPVNNLVEEHTPNYLAALEKLPDAKEYAYLEDGTMPGIYGLESEDPRRVIYYGPMIRQDWLDKLGLAQPTTIDEWYTILTAFKTQDPNGNGQADEIPWIEQKGSNLNAFVTGFGILSEFFVDPETGDITYGATRDEYKDFLITMNKWYQEGLIDPEFATNDGKMYNSKITSDKAGATAGYLSSTQTNLTAQGKQINPDFQLLGVPHVKAPNGIAYNADRDRLKSTTGLAAISYNCKNPEIALKVMDYGYTEEGEALLNWGIEGESYEVVDGKKVYTDKILNPGEGKTPDQAIIQYALPSAGWLKMMGMDTANELGRANPEQYEATLQSKSIWAEADNSLIIPYNVRLNEEESAEMSAIINEVNTYRDEMELKFILGTVSIEDEFDKYVQNMNKMGVEQATAIWQGAFERYK